MHAFQALQSILSSRPNRWLLIGRGQTLEFKLDGPRAFLPAVDALTLHKKRSLIRAHFFSSPRVAFPRRPRLFNKGSSGEDGGISPGCQSKIPLAAGGRGTEGEGAQGVSKALSSCQESRAEGGAYGGITPVAEFLIPKRPRPGGR
jgi:hypothetical protein